MCFEIESSYHGGNQSGRKRVWHGYELAMENTTAFLQTPRTPTKWSDLKAWGWHHSGVREREIYAMRELYYKCNNTLNNNRIYCTSHTNANIVYMDKLSRTKKRESIPERESERARN